jgi:peptide deformylase
MRFTVAAAGITLLSAMISSAGEKKGTRVSLRAAPRVAAAPVTIVFNVELAGGEDGEDLYCPVLEWEWGDGTRSVEDEDCPSFEAGRTPVSRRFTVSHEYRDRARPRVVVTVRKGDRVLGTANVALIIGDRKQPLRGSYRQTPD